MTIGPPIQCLACVRLRHDTAEVESCDAYPAGIPRDILEGAAHNEPRGDEVKGRVFRPADTQGARIALTVWKAMRGNSAAA
jgi:hypothetical protein